MVTIDAIDNGLDRSIAADLDRLKANCHYFALRFEPGHPMQMPEKRDKKRNYSRPELNPAGFHQSDIHNAVVLSALRYAVLRRAPQ